MKPGLAAVFAIDLAACLLGPAMAQRVVRRPPAESRDTTLNAAVRNLGSFNSADRERAARTLASAGDSGVTALLAMLTNRQLAVRVAAHDTLQRVLAARYHVAPASTPRYDPWAPVAARTAMAVELRKWWKLRGPGAAAAL
jgi:hypothetical protein